MSYFLSKKTALTRLLLVILCAGLAAGNSEKAAHSQSGIVFQDDFNSIDPLAWDIHTDSWYIEGTRFGKTPPILTEGSGANATTFARFTLDTYHPAYPGSKFFGTELWSKGQWTLGNGTEFEARIRETKVQRGICSSFYLYHKRDFNLDLDQEEIDYEFISNFINDPGQRSKLWLNIWNNGSNAEGTNLVELLDQTVWNTYTIRRLNDRVEWRVNGVLARTETNLMPDDALSIAFNIWAVHPDWSWAWDGNLKVANSAANNVSNYIDVDYVRVRSLAPPANAQIGTGTGLSGFYFSDTTLGGEQFSLPAPRVNFEWRNGSPDPTRLNANGWSGRWSGEVQAQFSENYTFSLQANDGVRLWLGDQLLIDNWRAQATTESTSAPINLVAGRRYPIRIEYFDGPNNANLHLRWSSASTPKQLIPTTQLYPLTVATPTFSPDGGAFSGPQRITIASATAGADIHYTLDGSAPDLASPSVASGATIFLGSTTTLQARAFKTGAIASALKSATFLLGDRQAPQITIASPIADAVLKAPPIFSGTASDAGNSGLATVSLRLRRDDNQYWNAVSNTWSATPVDNPLTLEGTNWSLQAPALRDGKYFVSVKAADGAGNAAATPEIAFQLQRTPALSFFSAPSASALTSLNRLAGSTQLNDAPAVSRIAVVIQRGVDGLYFQNDGTWAATVAEWTATGTGEWSLDFAAAPVNPFAADGAYKLTTRAYDTIGNRGDWSFEVRIDSLAPQVAWTAPSEGAILSSLPNPSGTVVDDGQISGVGVQIRRDSDGLFWTGAGWSSDGSSTNLSAALQGNIWTGQFPLPTEANLSEGAYTLTATAVDSAGNRATSSVHVTIDANAPTTVIISPQPYQIAGIWRTATGTATDSASGSGIAKVSFYLFRYANPSANLGAGFWNGNRDWTGVYAPAQHEIAARLENPNALTTKWTAMLPALPDGHFLIRATSTDRAGNASSSPVVTFYVDRTPPLVGFNSPLRQAPPGFRLLSLPSVSGSARDVLSGLSRVTVALYRYDSGGMTAGFWNGGNIWNPMYDARAERVAQGTANWRLMLPTLPPGRYAVRATAFDRSGNLSRTPLQTFTIVPSLNAG